MPLHCVYKVKMKGVEILIQAQYKKYVEFKSAVTIKKNLNNNPYFLLQKYILSMCIQHLMNLHLQLLRY